MEDKSNMGERKRVTFSKLNDSKNSMKTFANYVWNCFNLLCMYIYIYTWKCKASFYNNLPVFRGFVEELSNKAKERPDTSVIWIKLLRKSRGLKH